MTETEKMKEDLSYVRDAVEQQEERGTPVSIFLLWAVIIFAGFALVDFRPEWVWTYWMVMGPLGGVASWLIGANVAEEIGELDRSEGWRIAGHWGAFFVFFLLLIPLNASGMISAAAMGRVIVLVSALAYVLYGIHRDSAMLIPGFVLAVGYGALFFLNAYAWTILGGVVALSLVIAACTGSAPENGESDSVEATRSSATPPYRASDEG